MIYPQTMISKTMGDIIKHQTYQDGDKKALSLWRTEINEVLQSLGYDLKTEKGITIFSDNIGNQFEVFIGAKAQAEVILWQAYDELQFVRGHYLVCAMEVMLKCFGAKVYCRLNPFQLGFAIDFLYSSKESFQEMILAFINIAINARDEMNNKLFESNQSNN